MAGYVIHLAVGKIYARKNGIEDIEKFEEGIIAPDRQKDKASSHYGPYSSQPGLNSFLREQGISSAYQEGYFLHLVTDYLFYNRFLQGWDIAIYEDYNKLNKDIMQKYGVVIPEEIQEEVKFTEGLPSFLKEEEICKFINTVGRIDIRGILKQKEQNLTIELSELQF